MAKFNYEHWTVEITDEAGTTTWEFKGKDKDHVIKQIMKEVADSNSEQNLNRTMWQRKPMIKSVNWDSMLLDRTGYNRRF